MAEHYEVINAGGITVSDTAEGLWEGAYNYFQWCKANPIYRKRTLTSGKEAGKRVDEEYERPFTIKGLCLHCGFSEEYLRDIRMRKDKASIYYTVVSKIFYIIYVQNMELGMIGVLNPIFTAKVLNLDREEIPQTNIKVEVITQGIPLLSESENEVLEKIESELLNKDNGDIDNLQR